MKFWHFVFFLLLFPAQAFAQSEDPMSYDNRLKALTDDLSVMRTELRQIKRTPAIVSESVTGVYLDNFEMRIQDMEKLAAETTGQIEKLEYENRQLKQQMQKMRDDDELRFKQLEQKFEKLEKEKAEAVKKKAEEEKKKAEVAKKKAEADKKKGGDAKPVAKSAVKPVAKPEIKAEAKPETKAIPAQAKLKTAKEQYDEASDLVRKKQYKPAIEAFEVFIKNNPKSNLLGNAYYWIGECYYAEGRFEKAALAFGEGYQKHRTSAKAQDNLFKLGLTFQRLNKNEEACMSYATFQYDYPNAPPALKKRVVQEMQTLKCE